MADLPIDIVKALRAVVGPRGAPLHEPTFSGNEWRYLKECLDTTFVSSVGPFVDQFEQQLANYLGAKHVVAVVNGTAALHVALKIAGVKQNEEVLIPTLTFVATANAVAYCGAVPHFIESSQSPLGLDLNKLRRYLLETTEQNARVCINSKTKRVIRAIVPMHTFGHPVDLQGLMEIASDFNILVVEDAAESLGSTYKGKHTGTFGMMGTLSFNGNKTITTGGGGAIITNEAELAKRAKHLTTTAKIAHQWEFKHDDIGFNYRMPNLNAALGCAQLEELPGILQSKRRLFSKYSEAFSGIDGVTVVGEPLFAKSNFWLQTLLLNKTTENQREKILQATNSAGIMTRPIWFPLDKLKQFKGCPKMRLPVAHSLARRLINIPSSPNLV